MISQGKASRFVRHVAGIAGAAVAAQTIVVVATPVLTRLYTPSDFGVVAVFNSILAVGAVFATLRYESAIPLPREEEAATAVLDLTLGLSVAVACLVLVLGILYGDSLANALGVPTVQPLLWLVPVGVILSGFHASFTRWATRTRDYAAIARQKVSRSVAATITQTLLGLSRGAGPLGLALGLVAGQAVATALLAVRVPLGLTRTSSMRQRAAGALAAATRYRRFPLLSAPSAFLNMVTLHAPAILIAAAYGPVVAGFYALAQRVLGVPMGFLGSAIGEVFMGDSAEGYRDGDLRRIQRLFRKTFATLVISSVVLVGSVAVVAPWVAAFVFGDTWDDAGRYMRALAPMFAMGLVAAPFGSVLAILERQDLYFGRELIRAIIVIGALLLATGQELSAMQGMVALGLAGAVGYGIYVALSWYALLQAVRRRVSP